MSRTNPQYVRAGRARVAFGILMLFNFVGIYQVQRIATKNAHLIHQLADDEATNKRLTDRVANDEGQLRAVGNEAVVNGCVRLNTLKTNVAVALDQGARRTITAQTLVLHSATSTQAGREQALRFIASAESTLGIVRSIFGTEQCKGPF